MDADGPRRRLWQVVVADEAQRIKNTHTAIAAAERALFADIIDGVATAHLRRLDLPTLLCAVGQTAYVTLAAWASRQATSDGAGLQLLNGSPELHHAQNSVQPSSANTGAKTDL